MFPLIPALLLLFLQGQAPLERGRVPATLDGLPWQVVSHQRDSDARGDRPPVAQVCALLRLFMPKYEVAPPSIDLESKPTRPRPAARVDRLAEGFAHSQRSRDGPGCSV